jgi:signal transduction histidine kinase
MERQLRVMSRLVDDLLDVPRLARGKISILRERLDLARLVRECVGDRKGAFDDAGVTLTAELPGDPVWTTGDRTRLTQAVGNLLANALKFTDRGGTVAVRLSVEAARRAATLTVADTGVGIDPQFLPRVFEAFMQADRSLERTRGGLGLGLALVKGIVELHGGSVRAASGGTGRGAVFAVELPLLDLAPAAPEGGTPAAAPAPPKRVLVIEDDRDSAESLKMYLELLGHAVLVAHCRA